MAKLPTVSNFLCCLTLETGGLICGWFSLIIYAIALISMAVALIVGIATLSVGFIVVAIIYIIYFAIVIYASWMLIQGTKNRNPSQMTLFLILMAVGVILSFLQIFMVGLAGIGGAIFWAIVSAYIFICIYSLYEMLKGG